MTDTRLVRRVADALLAARCRRHLAGLDRLDPARAQTRILLGLLHRARATPFGRGHDFARIRSADDFRRLVPLRTLDELWQTHGRLDGATWPGPARQLLACDTGAESPRFLPLTPALEAAHRAANQTAMGLVQRVRPGAGFCSGSVVFLGEALSAARLAEGKGDVPAPPSARHLPWLARPYAVAEATVAAVARAAARTAATCLSGSVSALLKLLAEVKRFARRERVAEVWPGLEAVLWSRKPSDPPSALLREEVGGAVLLESVSRCGSPVAVEDPETGLLRWLPDHGVFFEFVPAEEAGEPQPTRLTFDRVETNVDHELVLTSPAGLWACRLGETVRFERREPPLFRFTEVRSQESGVRSQEMGTPGPESSVPGTEHQAPVTLHAPTQPPHRRSDGIPAARLEMFVRNPWSAPADRG
jgi:hypothetical protein